MNQLCCCLVAQWCPALCDTMDCSMPGLSVPHSPNKSPKVCPSSCILHQWCHPAISSSDTLFSFCSPSFPASGTFPMSQLFASDDENTGASASASVLPVSIQGWSPLRLTGFISLLSNALSGFLSSTISWRHQFSYMLTYITLFGFPSHLGHHRALSRVPCAM